MPAYNPFLQSPSGPLVRRKHFTYPMRPGCVTCGPRLAGDEKGNVPVKNLSEIYPCTASNLAGLGTSLLVAIAGVVYARNQKKSTLSTIGWGVGGFLAPYITTGLALADYALQND